MTTRINIKLNADKFGPLITELREFGKGMANSDSEMAAFALWFLKEYVLTPLPCGKTRLEIVLDSVGKTQLESMYEVFASFRRFCGD